jgi:hypothetical protein
MFYSHFCLCSFHIKRISMDFILTLAKEHGHDTITPTKVAYEPPANLDKVLVS